MAKNRKNQPAAIQFGPALKALLLCALFCGSGVGYVWQISQIGELGRQIRPLEKRLAELQAANNKARNLLASMRVPRRIIARLKELKLDMGLPLESQKLRLIEPVAGAPSPPPSAKLYVAQAAREQRAP